MSHNPRHSIGITGPAENILRTATVTLTDAQIKSLATGEVDLVPAPGAGKMNVLLFAVAKIALAASYTNVDALAFIGIGPSGGAVSSTLIDVSPYLTDFGSVPNSLLHFEPQVITTTAALDTPTYARGYSNIVAAEENLALTIKGDNNGDGAFTGGDAANTMTITVVYVVIDLV